METALLIGVVALVLFLLVSGARRRESPIEKQYRGAASYVISQLERDVPLDEAQRRARRLYGIDEPKASGGGRG